MVGVELLLVQLRVGLLGVRVWRGHLWDDIKAAHQHHLRALGGSDAGQRMVCQALDVMGVRGSSKHGVIAV